jgi:hypothetical protein
VEVGRSGRWLSGRSTRLELRSWCLRSLLRGRCPPRSVAGGHFRQLRAAGQARTCSEGQVRTSIRAIGPEQAGIPWCASRCPRHRDLPARLHDGSPPRISRCRCSSHRPGLAPHHSDGPRRRNVTDGRARMAAGAPRSTGPTCGRWPTACGADGSSSFTPNPCGTISAQFGGPGRGFTVLGERPSEELVLGTVGRFWRTVGELRPVSLASLSEPAPPGTAQAARSFAVSRRPGSAELRTETRVLCADPVARRRFRAYRLVIRPFSGLIRREMLTAVRSAAESDQGGR